MRYFIPAFLLFFLVQASAQEQRIGDTTATGIVSYSLRAISAKGTGNRLAYFDSQGRLIAGTGGLTGGWVIGGNAGTNYATSFLGTSDNQPLVFKANNVEGLRIVPSGQVGIGAPASTISFLDAQYKLFVYGSIRAQKIKVDVNSTSNPWADYVFEEAYKLPSLSEVASFVKRHKHLPDVPSAREVAEKGLDLGDNQTILLKKIEELTLYAIEQEKRLEQQEKRNRELEQRLERLEGK